jgi:succinate-semialdehyde dehydrogenase
MRDDVKTEVKTINPANGQVIRGYPIDDKGQVERIVAGSAAAYRAWRDTPIQVRSECYVKLADTLIERLDGLSRLITTEMGKPILEARAEIEKCAAEARWYAEHGPAMLADEPAMVGADEVYVSFLPIGVVLAVMPWNLPIWQVMRAAVPIMLSGNVMLLKHAPNVLGCAYALKEVYEDAGFPPGALNVVNADVEAVDDLLQDPRIVAVTLAGSVRAGSAVASLAGKAAKKSLLELGGSDPFIVLKDADIEEAVHYAILGRFSNTGQVCLAAKRLILEEAIAEDFTNRFVEAASKLTVGDPMDPKNKLGPIARSDLRDGLHKQVVSTRDQGAKLLLGGGKVDGPGFFYQPTVFGSVVPGMTAFKEETFGPVAAIIIAKDAEDAVTLANNSDFGLGGNLWTRDVVRARAIARRMETGAVFINGYTASNPRTPVGGVKQSGYGREMSYFGLREFVNAQTVWIRTTDAAASHPF